MRILFFLASLGCYCKFVVSASDKRSSNHNGDRPVIAILSQPLKGHQTKARHESLVDDHEKNTKISRINSAKYDKDQAKDGDWHYIAASYVKWVESAGARSIVLPYDADEELTREIFGQVNGILFPGGDAILPRSAHLIYEMAVNANKKSGEYFPIWGTCLGFEFLVALAANGGDSVLRSDYRSVNISIPLIMEDEGEGVGFGDFYSYSQLYPISSKVRKDVTNLPITFNNHVRGITPKEFKMDSGLTSVFQITSTNVDHRTGLEFVSTIEPKPNTNNDTYILPFFGTQYHPEKNNFEYKLAVPTNSSSSMDLPYENINHSSEAVNLSLHLAKFFVDRVRESTVGSYTLIKRHPLIYSYETNTCRQNTDRIDLWRIGFEEIYCIPPAKHWIVEDHQDKESITNDSKQKDRFKILQGQQENKQSHQKGFLRSFVINQ